MDPHRQLYVLSHCDRNCRLNSPDHSILTPGQPGLAMMLQRQPPGRAATRISVSKSLVYDAAGETGD